MLDLVGSFLIWSHRIAASPGNCSLHAIVTAVCVIPSHLNSSHLMSSQPFSPHLISAHLMSSLPFSSLSWSQLVSSLLMSPDLFSHLFSAHLNSSLLSSSQLLHSTQLVSTQLFSALHHSCPVRLSQLIPAFLRFSQLFSILLGSPQLMSAHLMSSHLVSPLLTSSKLFSHLLSWSQLAQRTLRASQLFSGPKPVHFPPSSTLYDKTVTKYCPALLCATLRLHKVLPSLLCTRKLAQSTSQYAFHRQLATAYLQVCCKQLPTGYFTQQAFTHSKLLQREAFTHRSFYTHKPLRTTMPEIAAPKLGLGARAKIRRFWQRNL